MNPYEINKILRVVNRAVYEYQGRYLNDVEEKVLIGSLKGLTYKEIAKESSHLCSTLARDVAPKLWRLLSEVSEEKVRKKNVIGAMRRLVEGFHISRVDTKSRKSFFIQKSLKALMHRLLNRA